MTKTMNNNNFHDSLYAPFGGFLLDKAPFSKIALKKRWSSVVYCPNQEAREPGAMYPRAIEIVNDKENTSKLLATFECYTFKKPYFPIYESIDDGKGTLYCFYSDEQYAKTKGYNQALLHKKSNDGGISWTEAKLDVAFDGGVLRPGMPVIAKLGDAS